MVPYKNSAGNSGVVAYEISDNSIAVKFIDGKVYVYTDKSAGADNIAQMKRVAKAGRGLSTFISKVVRDGYEFVK